MATENGGTLLLLSLLVLLVLLVRPGPSHARCFFSFDSRNAKQGNFSSPGHPDPYPGGTLCHYHFRGREWEGVRLLFHHFDLQPPYHAGCLSDYVEILTVDVQNTQRFRGRYCGSEKPPPLLVLTPGVELVFRSGQHVTKHRGFHGEFEFVDEETVTPPTPDEEDETAPRCGGVLTGTGGVLESPDFPSTFPGGLDCIWLLRAAYNHYLYLRVAHLELQSSIADCRRAQLLLLDGYGPHDGTGKPLRTFCGDLKYYTGPEERSLLSPRNRLLVRFTSSARDPASGDAKATTAQSRSFGFRIIWTQIAFDTPENCTNKGQFVCRHSEFCVTDAAAGGTARSSGNGGNSCAHRRFYCVAPSLVCDGRSNCQEGDNSDETDCYVSLLVAASIAAPLALLVPALLVCACHRKRARRKAAMLLRAPVTNEVMTPLRPRPLNQSPSRTRPQHLMQDGTLPEQYPTFGLISPASGFSDPMDDDDSELTERRTVSYTQTVVPHGNGFCPAHGGYVLPHSSIPSSSGSPGRGSLTSDATCRMQSSPGPSSISSPAPQHRVYQPRQRQAATMTSPPLMTSPTRLQYLTTTTSAVSTPQSLRRPHSAAASSVEFPSSEVLCSTVTTFGVSSTHIPTMSQRATDV